MKFNWILITDFLLVIIFFFQDANAYSPEFSRYRSADVSHTDRLFSEESRSPFVIYDQEDGLIPDSSNRDTPLVLLVDKPHLANIKSGKNPTSTSDSKPNNELETTLLYRFPPPRRPDLLRPSLQYGFLPVKPQQKENLTDSTTNNKEPTTNAKPIELLKEPVRKEATNTTTKPQAVFLSSVPYITTKPTTTVKPQSIFQSSVSYIPTKPTLTPTTIAHKDISTATAVKDKISKPDKGESLYKAENQNTYPNKQLIFSVSQPKQEERYFLYQRLPPTTAKSTVIKPQTKPPIALSLGEYSERKTIIKPSQTLNLGEYSSERKHTANDKKHSSTVVVTRTHADTGRLNTFYKAILDGRRAPTHSFTFFQSEVKPNNESAERIPNPSSEKITGSTQNQPVSSFTYKKFGFVNNDQVYDPAPLSTTLDGFAYKPQDSRNYELRKSSRLASPTPAASQISQKSIAPAETSISTSTNSLSNRVPGVPTIPGNFGYLSSGRPFGPQNIPGRAGADYPTYSEIPFTNFNCLEFRMPGFYADMEAGCQIFHTCDMDMRRHSFMCPNGTIFNQEFFTCDWWYNVKCDDSKDFFSLNQRLFIDPPKIEADKDKDAKN